MFWMPGQVRHDKLRHFYDTIKVSVVLLLNALEAGGEGTAVRIRTARDDVADQAVIEIADNGPGIAKELLPDALFEPFKTTKDGGSGIGLWQVKRVTAELGGSVTAANRSEGGARFVVRLPLKKI